jgi:hypothetical protein
MNYWSSDPALRDNYISGIMPRNRFSWLLGYIHLNDNSEMAKKGEGYDKLYKIRPLLEMSSKTYMKSYQPTKMQAIDESMTTFKGRSSIKRARYLFKKFKICKKNKQLVSHNTLKTVYYSYFNAIISYVLPFWGNSPHAIKILRMHKRTIRIMMGCKNRTSCRNLFRRLEILPFVSQCILSLMFFVAKNKK